MPKAFVEVKEIHTVCIEVEHPQGATIDEIRELAKDKIEEGVDDLPIEYNDTMAPKHWTVRDEAGNYLS